MLVVQLEQLAVALGGVDPELAEGGQDVAALAGKTAQESTLFRKEKSGILAPRTNN